MNRDEMNRYNALQKLIADRKRREALAAAVRPILKKKGK